MKISRTVTYKSSHFGDCCVPRVPGSKAQKVYWGAGFSQELISDQA